MTGQAAAGHTPRGYIIGKWIIAFSIRTRIGNDGPHISAFDTRINRDAR